MTFGLSTLTSNQKRTLGVLGLVGAGSALGVGFAVAASRRKKKRKARTQRARKTRARSAKVRGRRYTPHTAGKRKDRSTKRIRYTKNGQPYVIMRSGKARFIKKTGARRAHKRKGGRY